MENNSIDLDENGDDFYSHAAIKQAVIALVDALLLEEPNFDFSKYEVDPRAFYLKSIAQDPRYIAGDTVLGFNKLFFCDEDPVTVRFDINRYAVISPDFSCRYYSRLEPDSDTLDLAFIIRNGEAMEMYCSVISSIYYNKLDLFNIIECLKFRSPNSQFNLLKTISEHDSIIKPVFPENLLRQFIDSVNEIVKAEFYLVYDEIKPAIYKHWLDIPAKGAWDPFADLEPVIINDSIKIKSRITEKIIF